nr:MAG TPA: hypothetical protein [Caudoviricetes sp.]
MLPYLKALSSLSVKKNAFLSCTKCFSLSSVAF